MTPTPATPGSPSRRQDDAALDDLEQELASRFQRLREARHSRPVFLIEHGLAPDRLHDLRTLVGDRMRRCGVVGDEWRAFAHCLCVAVTEIAYSYQGTGTDFWPKVEAELRVEILHRERQEISELFARLHRQSGAAAPVDTDWVRVYGHIAWPVRNAVAPVEIHRPLTELLVRVMDGGVRPGSDVFVSHMRLIAHGMWSRRLHDWLLDETLAQEVVRRLLYGGDQNSWLDEAIVHRLVRDLAGDPVARRNLDHVRRAARPERKPPVRIGDCRWRLAVTDGRPTRLLLCAPVLGRSEARTLADAVDSGVAVNVPGSGFRSVPLAGFLDGEMIAVDPPLRAAEGVELLLEDGAPTQASLETMTAPPPRAFRITGPDGLFDGVARGARLPADAGVIILCWQSAPEAADAWQGPGWRAGKAGEPEIAGMLQQAGIAVGAGALANFGGAVGLTASGNELRLTCGLPLLCRLMAEDLDVSLDGVTLAERAPAGRIVDLPLIPGTYELTVGNRDTSATWTVRAEPPEDQGSVLVESVPARPSIEDLLGEQIEIVLHSPVLIGPVGAQFDLIGDGRVLDSAEATLETLPCRLGPASEPVGRLRARAVEALRAGSAARLSMSIALAGLGRYEIPLPPRPVSCRWIPGRDAFIDRNGHMIGVAIATGADPFPRPAGEAAAPVDDVVLRLPDEGGVERCLSGVVSSPGRAGLFTSGRMPAIRTRRATANPPDRTGFDAALDAFLAWRCAGADNLVADRRRHAVASQLEFAIVEALCGEAWAGLESSNRAFGGDDLLALAAVCIEEGLAAGEAFPRLERADRRVLTERLRAALASAVPSIRRVTVDDELAAVLDGAVASAYEELNDLRRSINLEPFEEPDPGNTPERWSEALKQAADKADHPVLRRFILPSARWVRLSRLDYTLTSGADLVDALDRAHLDIGGGGRGRWLGREALKVALQLWLAPRDIFETEAWRSHLHRLLSDRHTARAVRYVALRSRMAAGQGRAGYGS